MDEAKLAGTVNRKCKPRAGIGRENPAGLAEEVVLRRHFGSDSKRFVPTIVARSFPRTAFAPLFFFFVFVRVVPLPAWLMLGYWMLLQVFASTLTPEGAGGVAYLAPIGGFAAGIVLVPVFRDQAKAKTRRHRRERGWW